MVTLRDGTTTQQFAYTDVPLEDFDESELSTTLTPSLTTPTSQTRGRVPKIFPDMIDFSIESENEPKTDDSEFI